MLIIPIWVLEAGGVVMWVQIGSSQGVPQQHFCFLLKSFLDLNLQLDFLAVTSGVGQNLTGKILCGIPPQHLCVSVVEAFDVEVALVECYSGCQDLNSCPALCYCSSILLVNYVCCKHTGKHQLTCMFS